MDPRWADHHHRDEWTDNFAHALSSLAKELSGFALSSTS